MNIQTFLSAFPDYAKDIKLNLGSILTEEGSQDLSQNQIYGIALASAYTTRQPELIEAIEAITKNILSQEQQYAAKSAATIMAMNNVYYRFVHLVTNKEYAKLPAKLRMNAIADPGIEQTDFELYALGISAINGCGMCIDAHVNQLAKSHLSIVSIQSCVRIAAVINAAAQTLI